MAKERLSHSDYKRIIELSNPSLPDYGIDEAYQKSDQRHWTTKCGACGTWTAMDKEFPIKLSQEVRIILPRPDGSFYRACPKCAAELDVTTGEWVADLPSRSIHGYRISQLTSTRVDPGEILHDYRTTRHPDRFYNLKIGIPWADLDRRLDVASVLRLCGEAEMATSSQQATVMGVDTGRQLHAVILRPPLRAGTVELVHVAVLQEFSELDELLRRFHVRHCVIDGLPETHATRDFARRNHGRVILNFFNEHQRGSAAWKHDEQIVQINRTEALDASRAAIREQQLVLPRETPLLQEFARHMASDAKILEEDEDTGAKKFKYIRTGPDHFSLAFTYAWMAAVRFPPMDLSQYGWLTFDD
jgi:hypothetical protein